MLEARRRAAGPGHLDTLSPSLGPQARDRAESRRARLDAAAPALPCPRPARVAPRSEIAAPRPAGPVWRCSRRPRESRRTPAAESGIRDQDSGIRD